MVGKEIKWRVTTAWPETEGGLRAYLLGQGYELFAENEERRQRLAVFRERNLESTVLLASSSLAAGDCLVPLTQFKYLNIWEAVKCAALEAYNLASSIKISPLVLLLDGPGAAGFHKKALEGILLGTYTYEHFKRTSQDDANDDFQPEVVIVCATPGAEILTTELARIETVCRVVNHVRELVNHPASSFGPEDFADEAVRTATACGLKIDVWDESRLEREGCNGLLAVGRGSHRPPRLVRLDYEPASATEEAKHVVLVGKGITFDSGGLSLKPGGAMMDMKSDMAGAAAVLGTMEIIGRLGARIRVSGILALAENMPDGNAQRPGDIIVMRNGKTVEVKNTDAEGRLILADALQIGAEMKPDMIVDVATLTGACRVALGTQLAAVLGRDRELVERVVKAGKESGEILWELPFEKAYIKDMKSDFADIANISSKAYGGTITAALFLGEFVPEEIPWAHLDIAGPAYLDKKWKYFAPGATGFGARILAGLIKNLV